MSIARQRGFLSPGTSIWACLTASNHEIHEIPSCDEIYPSAELRAHDNNRHGTNTASNLDTQGMFICNLIQILPRDPERHI